LSDFPNLATLSTFRITVLWTLRKGEKTANARTRMVPAGPELRNLLQRLIPRSEVVRDGRNVGDVAEAAKAEWLGRGCVVE
jgi:hypothetical protein